MYVHSAFVPTLSLQRRSDFFLYCASCCCSCSCGARTTAADEDVESERHKCRPPRTIQGERRRRLSLSTSTLFRRVTCASRERSVRTAWRSEDGVARTRSIRTLSSVSYSPHAPCWETWHVLSRLPVPAPRGGGRKLYFPSLVRVCHTLASDQA